MTRALMLSGVAVGALWAPSVRAHAAESAGNAAAMEAPTTEAAAPSSDIIVTARRVEERLQDVPISITVFNQQQITNRNVTTAEGLATYTPSLTANTNFGVQNATFAIRGFAQTFRTTASVATYFADVVSPRGPGSIPAGDGAGPGNFFDLQNVQVLKGPQGTLFGRNTTGGAILLVPQKPTSRLEGYIEGSYGNYDMKRVQAVFNTPLGDRARFRIGVDRETRDGYVRNDSGVGPSRFNNIDYIAVRASLVVDLTPNLENYTIASFVRSDTNGELGKVVSCNPSPDPANFLGQIACGQIAAAAARGGGFHTAQSDIRDPVSRLSQWQIINTTTWTASDALTIKNIASYSQITNLFRGNIFGTNFFLAPGLPLSFAEIRNAPGLRGVDQSSVTEELQFQGRALGDRFTWQAGGYFERSTPMGANGGGTPVVLTCTDPAAFQCTDYLGMGAGFPIGSIALSSQRSTFRNLGVYGQGTLAIGERIKLTGGIRYTDDRTDVSTDRVTVFFPMPNTPVGICTSLQAGTPGAPVTAPGQCLLNFSQKSNAPTWLAGVDYKPMDDLLLYAKYARGYRQGTVDPSSADGFETFKPEKVDTYEIGSKLSFTGPIRGTLNLAGFYNRFRDQQLQVQFTGPSVAPSAGIVNAGKSRIYGAEVEASISPVIGFTVDASYAYLNSKLQSIVAPVLVPGGAYTAFTLSSQQGDQLPLAPKHKLTTTASYALPLNPEIGKITIAATYTYTSRQLVNRGGPGGSRATIQPTNLVNANLNWNSVLGSPIDLSAFATNLTNRKYFSYVGGNYASAGFEYAQLAEPRMYGARLRYRFGH